MTTAAAGLVELRVRTRTSPDELALMVGKVPAPSYVHALLTGPAAVFKPDGSPLCVYLPGVLADQFTPEVYAVLAALSKVRTNNRGMASGTVSIMYPGNAKRRKSAQVSSSVIGVYEGPGGKVFCRLTAWTGRNLPQWRTLHPLLRAVAERFGEHVPARAAAQQAYADAADPAWVVPGTPFTTVTVNNSYSTGMHTDRGDLDAGFSTIAVHRRGEYDGGVLVFPEYRIGVDMRDGDLLLMDAHEWHANTPMTCACGVRLWGPCKACGAERISVVAYFRTKVAECGTPAEELRKGQAILDRRNANPPPPEKPKTMSKGATS